MQSQAISTIVFLFFLFSASFFQKLYSTKNHSETNLSEFILNFWTPQSHKPR